MPRKQHGRGGAQELHTHLSISVERYEVSLSTSINHSAYEPQLGWLGSDDDPVLVAGIRLHIFGTCTWPNKRAGDHYEITLSGDNASSPNLDAKLHDLAERDEFGSPRHRQYRGRDIPVYKPPLGLGLLEKISGEAGWRAWIFERPSLVQSWLTLLLARRELFIGLHECKALRSRWIRGLELTTQDPSET